MPQLRTLEARQQRRQEIIDQIRFLCKANHQPIFTNMEAKVKELTCSDTGAVDASELAKWDEENVNPDLIASFIYANVYAKANDIKGTQRADTVGAVGAVGDMSNDYTSNFASVGVDYRENARFMTPSGYNNAAQGLNTYLDNDLYKDGVENLDWSKQLPALKRFAVANTVFIEDFVDAAEAKEFYNNLSQLNIGDCSNAKSVRDTLLAAASLKAGFDFAQTQIILDNVNDDIDNYYTEDRAQVFKTLYDRIIHQGGATSDIAIKKASIIFNSKKVDQSVVEKLEEARSRRRTKFAEAVVNIDVDALGGRNQLAFAAALAAADDDADTIKEYLANAGDTFRPENTEDFEYSLTRAQVFKGLYTELTRKAGVTKEDAIKKASIIFDSKKVSQDVVNKLKTNAYGERAKFAEAVDGMNIDINAPEDRNKLAFIAALTTTEYTSKEIKYFRNHALDTFSPENAKDFEYSSSRAQAFLNLYFGLHSGDYYQNEIAIKKASIIFDSKKVNQRVVNKLIDDTYAEDRRTEFAEAVADMNIDINEPEDRNKLTFAAALAAADDDADTIKEYLANAGDTFRPENTKDFEYSLTRVQVFKKLYDKLLEDIDTPTDEQKQAAIKKASIIFDSKKVNQRVVNNLNRVTNNTQRTAFKDRVAAVNGDTPEDRNKLAFAADIAAQNFEKELKELKVGDYNTIYSIRKTLIASALLKEGLTVTQSKLVLDRLNNFFGSDDNKIALTPERLQAYASTMKAVIDEIGISDQKKLNQANGELLDLLRSNKIKDESVAYFNAFAPDQKKSIVLKGYLKDACEELDKSTTVDNYNDLVKNIGQRYEKQIEAFKDRLSERNDLDPSLKDLVLSDNFLKIDDVAKNLSKGQIESLEKLDSASFRSIVSLLNTVSKKPSHVTDVYSIAAEDLTKCINTLFGQGNEVTSDTISENFSNAFSQASEKIITGTLKNNKYPDGGGYVKIEDTGAYKTPTSRRSGSCGVDTINSYIDTVASNSYLGVEAQADLKTFLQNMAHYDPSMIVGKNAEETLTLFNTFDCSSEMVSFLTTYKQAVQNGVSKDKIEAFYTTFNKINLAAIEGSRQIEDVKSGRGNDLQKISTKGLLINQCEKQTKNYLETQNEILSYSIEQEIKKNKQADKELDESNAEEESKEKQKIKNVKIVDEELKNKTTGSSKLEGAYELHKSCLEDKDGQINDAYAVGLLAFTHTKGIDYDDTTIILGNIYNKIKDEEDKKDILSNIVSSGGLIVYKDILKKDEFDLSLLRKMAINAFDDDDEKIIKTLDNTAQENLKGTLCENKDGKVCLDRRTKTKEIGKEYEFTKTEWISYMAENGSKIKSADYEFANMNEEQKDAFKKACLYLSPKLLEQEAVCAAISQNIDKIKDDPEFFIHAINETYSKRNIEDKKTTLDTVIGIIDKTVPQKANILDKMTKEDFLELKGDAVWNVIKDDSYTTKMVPYNDAVVGTAITRPTDDKEKEYRRLYNSIVANSNDSTIFTDGGNKPAAAGGAAAAGEIGYDGLKLNDYLSNCENASQRQTATKEIISAINNFESDFFPNPTAAGTFYGKEGYAQTIFNDISGNNHLNITLKSRKVAPTYQQKVEETFVWKQPDGSLLVDNDKLNSDTEIKLIQKLSVLDSGEYGEALNYLQGITDEYKTEKDAKSRDIFLKHVATKLSKVNKPTLYDFQTAALKSILETKGISKEDQNLLFKNPERAKFFIQHSKMFLDMDKEEFTQIFKKSQDPVKNDKVIDKIVAVAKKYGKDRYWLDFKDPIKQEFIIRSAAYLSADSVIDRFQECTKLQFAHQPSLIHKYARYRNTYRDATTQVEKELALEKARYVNLSYTRDHWGHTFSFKYSRLNKFEDRFKEILEGITDQKAQLLHLRNVNKDLALLVNTTKTGKKYDKVLNEQTPIKKYAKNVSSKHDLVTQSKDKNFNLLANSINEFVYNGKNKESAEGFAKALMRHVKEKRDAAAGAAYDKNAVEGDLLTTGTGFLVNNPQYIAINNALGRARADTLEKRKLKKQLDKLTDLAKLYVKYDDEPKKLEHILENGMDKRMHEWQYDRDNDKMKTDTPRELQETIRCAAMNSSTHALTGIHNIDNKHSVTVPYDPVMFESLSGLDSTDYFKDDKKSYADIANAINTKHVDAKTKKVRGKSTEPEDREIKHDELYKIEGLETFLVYTYNRARARALDAGMSPEEADFRAMAMTQAMDRKILTDDTFRTQVEEQIEKEEKQKIKLLMLGYVKDKAAAIYTTAATKSVNDMNAAIEYQVNAVTNVDSFILKSIVDENDKAKAVLDNTVIELKSAIITKQKGEQFNSSAEITTLVEEREEASKRSLSNTRYKLEKLCTRQLDTIEEDLEFIYQGYEQKKKAKAIIVATSNDYRYNTECRSMIENHASKLDNFSDEDLQNFGIACNALVLDNSIHVGNTDSRSRKETKLDNLSRDVEEVIDQGLAKSTVADVVHTIATATTVFVPNKKARSDASESTYYLVDSTKQALKEDFSSDAIKDVVSVVVNAKKHKEAFEWNEWIQLSQIASKRIKTFADTTENLITTGCNVVQIKKLATAIKNAKDDGVKKKGLLQVKDVRDAIGGIGGGGTEREAFVNAIKDVYDLCEGNTIENIVHTIANAYTNAIIVSAKENAAKNAAMKIKNVSDGAYNTTWDKISADTAIDLASTTCHIYDTTTGSKDNKDKATNAFYDNIRRLTEGVVSSYDENGDSVTDNFYKKWIKFNYEEDLDRGMNKRHIMSCVNSSIIKPSFEKIESSQTLAKVSKLIADEVKKGKNKSIISDTKTQAKLLLLLATDSKTDALDTLVADSSINDNVVLSSLASEDFKKLNKKQKTSILKKVDATKLDVFTQYLIDQGMVESLELYDILKNNVKLKKNSNQTLNTLENLGDGDIITYKAIEDCKTIDRVIEQVATEITYDENKAATDNDIILYEKAGKKIKELSSKGGDFGKEFASLINDYGKTDADRDEKYEQEVKQKIAYAFVFADNYKEGSPGSETLTKACKDLLKDLEPENKQYVLNALVEKECGRPDKDNDITPEKFTENVLKFDKMLDKEDKVLFANTVKQYMHKISGDSQKFSDIFTALCNSQDDNASLHVANLLEDQIELSKSGKTHIKNAPFMAHTSYGVEHNMPNTEEIITNAIKKISVGTDTKEKRENTTNNFYELVKNLSSEKNKSIVMNGIMSYIESLDDADEQAKLSVSLAKMFTKNVKTEEDRKLGDQLLTSMARNFAGNEELFIAIINQLDKDKTVEGNLQAELFYHYSKYADSVSTKHVYDNTAVKDNKTLEDKYYKTSDGSYSKKNNRDIDDILEEIGISKKEDQELIKKQLKRCSDKKAVAEVLNSFIDEHNKLAEEEGRGKVDKINSQDMQKISKQIMMKRKDLLKGLISGDEKIFEGGSVMLDAVEKYAQGMSNDGYNAQNVTGFWTSAGKDLQDQQATTKSELLSAVSKMRQREKTFKAKADVIKNCKEFNYKRALTAADFLSKMTCANEIITNYKAKVESGYYPNSYEKMRYEAAIAKKKELLSQKYDFTQSGRHWWNFKTLPSRMWNSFCKGMDYAGQYALGHFAGSLLQVALVGVLPAGAIGGTAYLSSLAVGLTGAAFGWAIAGIAIVGIAASVFAGIGAYKLYNSGLKKHIGHWPDYWHDKALKIKEQKLMEKAEATLKKSNHALAVLDGKKIVVKSIQNLSDKSTTEQMLINNISEQDMELRSKRLRGIRGTRFWGINDFTGEDGIEHTFRKGTIRRTNDMNASEAFADMKLKKYDKDMTAIIQAFATVKAVGLGEKSELPSSPLPEKKADLGEKSELPSSSFYQRKKLV